MPLFSVGGTLETQPSFPTHKNRGRTPLPHSILSHSPVRHRLAEGLFAVAPLRNEMGRATLRDLITLYKSDFEVEHRLGLEPERCRCPKHPDQDE